MKALIVSELRQRIRGKRWWILIGLWFAVLLGLVALIRQAVDAALRFDPDPVVEVGAIMFGSLALLVLALACLIVPALTATSINGERDRGTLAMLQASLYRPLEIAGAKFVAAMATALVFLGASVPIAVWAAAEGGVSLGQAVVVYLTLFVVCAVFTAGALAASALVKRPVLSAVAAYGFVFFLTIGTGILFGVALATAPRDPNSFSPDAGARWVILSPNPFVVLADAAPATEGEEISDPLSGIREGVRSLREPPPAFPREGTLCRAGNCPPPPEPPEPGPVWPAGLAIELSLAGGAGYLTVRRLRVPAARLGPGERIA